MNHSFRLIINKNNNQERETIRSFDFGDECKEQIITLEDNLKENEFISITLSYYSYKEIDGQFNTDYINRTFYVYCLKNKLQLYKNRHEGIDVKLNSEYIPYTNIKIKDSIAIDMSYYSKLGLHRSY